MSHLSNFTSKFRANINTSQEAKVIKRPRESLSCSPCRNSKLRCDRGQPCSGCAKKDVACSYQRSTASKPESRHNVAEDRLLHLESMVKSLMQERATLSDNHLPAAAMIPPEISTDPVELPDQTQNNKILSGGYVGSTHWSAILDDIHDLKAVLGGPADHQETEASAPGRPAEHDEIIFGSSDEYFLQQIISQHLPPKIQVDRALSTYFSGETFIVPFVHIYQFQRQYQEFWTDTANVSPLWLSMLFSVCYMASIIGVPTDPSQCSRHDLSAGNSDMHSAAGKCLVLGQYHRRRQFSVEALAMYGHCKNLRTLETSREAGAILSMVVRMAYELGYHRDPDSFGSFTVFDGEMRRRVWASLRQMDQMLSFKLGLPSFISLENCDSKSPRNLLDSDFGPDTQVLPPARPETEATKLLWLIVKDRLIVSFGKVCQDALSFKEKSEYEIVALDNEIREEYKTVPRVLLSRPISDSLADSPFIIMIRMYINFMHLKSICVLHRKYMARGSVFSTKCCVEAGTKMVTQFIDMYKEFAPGGQLHMARWMLTNFTMNDFLLAVMVLCLAVHTRWRRGPQNCVIDASAESEVLLLLQQCHTICVEKSTASRDARRVSYAIRLTLNNAKSPNKPANASPDLPSNLQFDSQVAGTVSLCFPHQNSSIQTEEAAFGVLDPFNFMDNDFENMDWSLFDSQFLGQDTSFTDGFIPG